MMKSVLLLVVLGLLDYARGNIYGLVTGSTQTQTLLQTVLVSPTNGSFSLIAENIVYVGPSLTFDGISGFDQKRQILYYSTNYGNAFVFGLDVSKNALQPPISINANSIDSIEWDALNSQLLIAGTYADNSVAVVTYPTNGQSELLVNFTAQGIRDYIYGTTIDNKKGVYYFAFYDEAAEVFNIGSFPISSPKSITINKMNCGQGLLAANFIFFDSGLGKIVGVGFNTTVKQYNYFEIVSNTCTVKSLGVTGIVTCATYDPTATTLYLGYTGDVNALLFYNTKTYTLTKVSTPTVLSDLQVSYTV